MNSGNKGINKHINQFFTRCEREEKRRERKKKALKEKTLKKGGER